MSVEQMHYCLRIFMGVKQSMHSKFYHYQEFVTRPKSSIPRLVPCDLTCRLRLMDWSWITCYLFTEVSNPFTDPEHILEFGRVKLVTVFQNYLLMIFFIPHVRG